MKVRMRQNLTLNGETYLRGQLVDLPHQTALRCLRLMTAQQPHVPWEDSAVPPPGKRAEGPTEDRTGDADEGAIPTGTGEPDEAAAVESGGAAPEGPGAEPKPGEEEKKPGFGEGVRNFVGRLVGGESDSKDDA